MIIQVEFCFKGDNIMHVTELTGMLSKTASGYQVDRVSSSKSLQKRILADFKHHSDANKPILFALGKAFYIEVNELR